MEKRLFLGVADNNYSSTAVLGDSEGKIVSTGTGGSVNYQLYGLAQASKNLKNLLDNLGSCAKPEKLAMACFTYKSGVVGFQRGFCHLLEGKLAGSKVQLKEYTAACSLGIPVPKERMLLFGGRTGIVVFDNLAGQRYRLSYNYLSQDLTARIEQKREHEGERSPGMKQLLAAAAQSLQMSKREKFTYLVAEVSALAEQGNPQALEIAYDIACDFVRLVCRMAKHMQIKVPTIGLYGQILLGSPVIYERVKHLLNLLYPAAELYASPLAPAKGAYLASLLAKKFKINGQRMANLAVTAKNMRRKHGLGLNNYDLAK